LASRTLTIGKAISIGIAGLAVVGPTVTDKLVTPSTAGAVNILIAHLAVVGTPYAGVSRTIAGVNIGVARLAVALTGFAKGLTWQCAFALPSHAGRDRAPLSALAAEVASLVHAGGINRFERIALVLG